MPPSTTISTTLNRAWAIPSPTYASMGTSLSMEAYVGEGMAQARFSVVLMVVLGGIALVLAAVGIFGVISYSVTQRTREFGIRLALGEDPGATRRSVVFGGLKLVGTSLVIGLVALSRSCPAPRGFAIPGPACRSDDVCGNQCPAGRRGARRVLSSRPPRDTGGSGDGAPQ